MTVVALAASLGCAHRTEMVSEDGLMAAPEARLTPET
jgi:hypothetical protein